MSLPFMKHKEYGLSGGTSSRMRKPDEKPAEEQSDANPGMEAVASDLLRAFEQKDIKHIALALCSAFQIYESTSHEDVSSDDEGQE